MRNKDIYRLWFARNIIHTSKKFTFLHKSAEFVTEYDERNDIYNYSYSQPQLWTESQNRIMTKTITNVYNSYIIMKLWGMNIVKLGMITNETQNYSLCSWFGGQLAPQIQKLSKHVRISSVSQILQEWMADNKRLGSWFL